MDARVAWVLNLDADFELAFGPGYAPKKSVRERASEHVRSLVGTLTHERDIVVGEGTVLGEALVGRAFCPTPGALALLRRAGAEPEPHPSFDVLRLANSRAFCQGLGATMPHASFETDLVAAAAKLRSEPKVGDGWRVKRSFGTAGRGQRVVRPGEDTPFLRAWMDEGGAQIEPNVAIVLELGMHALLTSNGEVSIGALVTQTCDAAGAWLSTERAVDQARASAMREQILLVAGALHAAGYFGPFGVDAFEWSGGFQPRSEINARYSMGFAVGFR